MNRKLGMPELAELLAAATGETKRGCEEFMRELFAIVSEALVAGESVRIKRLGTFKISDIEQRRSVDVSTGDEISIPPHKRIVFIPSKEMAERVNREFEMLFPVELADGVTDEMLAACESPETAAKEDIVVSEGEDSDDDAGNAPAVIPDEVEMIDGEESCDSLQTEDTPEDEEREEETTKERKSRSWLKFCLGLVVGAAIMFGFGIIREKQPSWWRFGHKAVSAPIEKTSAPVVKEEVKPVSTDTLPTTLSGDDVPTAPSDTPIYDTITATRYLTTLAREYYGDYRLWPYIYEANKGILGHPNHIKPGTRVVVPSLRSIGVSADSKKDIARAQKLSEEIYSKYKR